MADAAMIRATFSDYRTVKGRKVLQLVCEVPIEEQGLAFGALGYPVPDETIWVAIARLKEPAASVEQIEDHRPAKLAQLAGIMCNEGGFWAFLTEQGHECTNKEQAAEHVRLICGAIRSRAELDTNEQAAAKFRELRGKYQLWLKDAA